MNRTLQDFVLDELSSDGTWQLTDVVKSVLRCQISRLPRREVSDDETRYPQTPGGMRTFLVKFFARHYLQTQHSLIEYMTSQQFLDTVRTGHLRILDIGSGPAVASLAITDMIACILGNLRYEGEVPQRKVKVDYVLNDTSGICLGTGQRMLSDYFGIARSHSKAIVHNRTIRVQTPFPDNMHQLRRISSCLGTYDIAILSYVISPLNDDNSLSTLVNGLLNTERLCNRNGRILILQDRFHEALVRRISGAMGIPTEEQQMIQEIYPKRTANQTYTYSYYRCLYVPNEKMAVSQSSVA